jgi:hypothetical protein
VTEQDALRHRTINILKSHMIAVQFLVCRVCGVSSVRSKDDQPAWDFAIELQMNGWTSSHDDARCPNCTAEKQV